MRRFPPPWTVEKIPGGLVVRDANGQALAYLYARENVNDANIAKGLTEDEARRIATNIAELPSLLAKGR
jgi:predicted transcriptional regulator